MPQRSIIGGRRCCGLGATSWMSKHGTLTERMRGTAATPMNLMWAAGAALWQGSSWSGSRYPPAAAGWTSAAARDPSPAYVAFARSRANDARVRFEVGDAQALQAASATFDAVVSGLVLNFVPEPDRAVALPAVRAGTTDRPLPDDRTRQGRGTCHRRTDRLPRLRRLLVSFPGWPGTRARLRDVAESRAAGGAS